ncbi:MAG: tRNA (adenine(22)-N(1))-methyltransferase TrmK [Streptococcaceae bacterium]|jgi:tRNA (adenine22-N1)-methyltransferase|nr:tRNA (adenine(22)-N(1))-methyltransferase TrmK [Streptococcaceae bacterium]
MNEFQLSKRLEKVASFVATDSRVADIGSDHAYLIVSLMTQGKIEYGVAGEVVKGPFQSAVEQIKKSGYFGKIHARLASGLDAIHSEDGIDTVVIAGMGGVLIRDILSDGFQKGKLEGVKTLILQPNVGEMQVREWLIDHGFQVEEEAILIENDKIYEIIKAVTSPSPVQANSRQLRFGFHLLEEKNEVFVEKWKRELETAEFVSRKLKEAKTPNPEKELEIASTISEIKEVLS